MKRHYYVSDDLDDLELVEQQLEEAGVSTPQIHVLSEDETGLAEHNLHTVEAVLKKDVVHGTSIGAIVGVLGAGFIISLFWWHEVHETYTWVPAIFLSIIVLGFCTWEGGLIGIGKVHTDFQRFEDELREGRHVLFVDFDRDQEDILREVIARHPKLQDAGEGRATPKAVVSAQNVFSRVMKTAP